MITHGWFKSNSVPVIFVAYSFGACLARSTISQLQQNKYATLPRHFISISGLFSPPKVLSRFRENMDSLIVDGSYSPTEVLNLMYATEALEVSDDTDQTDQSFEKLKLATDSMMLEEYFMSDSQGLIDVHCTWIKGKFDTYFDEADTSRQDLQVR